MLPMLRNSLWVILIILNVYEQMKFKDVSGSELSYFLLPTGLSQFGYSPLLDWHVSYRPPSYTLNNRPQWKKVSGQI